MNYVQILDTCKSIGPVLSIIKWAINLICYAVPILLIVLLTIDVVKIVTAGNLDDKMKKEVGSKIVTRLIYAVVIFLIPVIINAVFGMLPSKAVNDANGAHYDASWWDCYREA